MQNWTQHLADDAHPADDLLYAYQAIRDMGGDASKLTDAELRQALADCPELLGAAGGIAEAAGLEGEMVSEAAG